MLWIIAVLFLESFPEVQKDDEAQILLSAEDPTWQFNGETVHRVLRKESSWI